MNVSRVIARVGGFVEVKTRRAGELMRNDAETGRLQAPEVLFAVARMRIETFILALEVASGILIKFSE